MNEQLTRAVEKSKPGTYPGTFFYTCSDNVQTCAEARQYSRAAAPPQGQDDECPLKADENAVGRLVLVPRTMWPDYTCLENGGAGWVAEVRKVRHGWATLSFLYDKDELGRPAADEILPLKLLTPLKQSVPLRGG